MRMWEPGDPIEGGNAIGIPDVDYFDYLRTGSRRDDRRSRDSSRERHIPQKRNFTREEVLKMARQALDRQDYTNALKLYERALEFGYSEEGKCGKAECLHKLGRDQEASRLYYELGDRYTWGDRDEKKIAVKYYKKSLECDANNEDALDNMGYALRGLERYDEALTYYRRIRHKDVDWAMAMCYMELKKYGDAIPLLDNVIRECPYCDSHLDEKCECLIGLNRKNEAIVLWKNFIDFLMKNDCYERAIERLDMLSQNTKTEGDFITDRRQKCIKNKNLLDARFKRISDAMSQYHMYNPKGLDENDLKGFLKFVCEESGESVDDIIRWYETPMLGSSSFRKVCLDHLFYGHWDRMVKMYEQGKLRDL